MKHINQTSTYGALLGMGLLLMSAVFAVAPARAHAFDAGRLFDPLCLFACDDDPEVNTYTYTNSNNVNSNINSPGATVNAGNETPVYDYAYNNYGSLEVTCYPTPLSADEGDTVTWHASAYGGNGSYHYSWSGTDGLSGQGQNASKRYNNPGYKNASVTVTSGNKTISRNCDGSVYIREDRDYDDRDYYDYDRDLYVSCSADDETVRVGDSVRWSASASGGSGSYDYDWDGDEGLHGSNRSVTIRYDSPGRKYASVTVYSGGRRVTEYCRDNVYVDGYATTYVNSYNYNSNVNYNNSLDAACYADPATARVNQPVTWKSEVTGGRAPYTYSWTGSDGLTGTDSGALKYYAYTGEKNAVVTVKSADGRASTVACSNTATIRGAAAASDGGAATVKPAPKPAEDEDNGLSAAALFSLKNVPWGWVAILIILVLFATVAYLLFNRPKI